MTPAPAEKPRIPRPVWFLGLTSLFTDAATEMIYPLLPVYLSRVLGAGALSLGIIEGVAEGVNSLLKVLSGYWTDRSTRRRPIVIGGYAISSIALLFFVDEAAAVDSNPRTSEPRTTTNYQPPTTNQRLPGRVVALLGVLLVFSLGNSADAFLLLRLSDALGGATYVPLLWAAIHV